MAARRSTATSTNPSDYGTGIYPIHEEKPSQPIAQPMQNSGSSSLETLQNPAEDNRRNHTLKFTQATTEGEEFDRNSGDLGFSEVRATQHHAALEERMKVVERRFARSSQLKANVIVSDQLQNELSVERAKAERRLQRASAAKKKSQLSSGTAPTSLLRRLRFSGQEVATGRVLSGHGSSVGVGDRWPVSLALAGGSMSDVPLPPRGIAGSSEPRELRWRPNKVIVVKPPDSHIANEQWLKENYGKRSMDAMRQKPVPPKLMDMKRQAKKDFFSMICPTLPVTPYLPKKMDDQVQLEFANNVKWPDEAGKLPIQMWEPFIAAAILCMPHYEWRHVDKEEDVTRMFKEQAESDELGDGTPQELTWHEAHVEKLLLHNEKSLERVLPGVILKVHCWHHPSISNYGSRFGKFLVDFLKRKFEPCKFDAGRLHVYMNETLHDPRTCMDKRTPRSFAVSPFLLQLLANDKHSCYGGQYEELVDVMIAVGLPACNIVDVVRRKRRALMERAWYACFSGDQTAELNWDLIRQYLDESMILKRYGGLCLKDDIRVDEEKDLVLRKVGATLQEVLSGKNIFGLNQTKSEDRDKDGKDLGSEDKDGKDWGSEDSSEAEERRLQLNDLLVDDDDDADGMQQSMKDEEALRRREARQRKKEWEAKLAGLVDPEDPRFRPLGFSLTEMFLLFHGMVSAIDKKLVSKRSVDKRRKQQQLILRTSISRSLDRHVLAAALIIDLYMREKVEVWAWQLANANHTHFKARPQGVFVADAWMGPIACVYKVQAAVSAPLFVSEAPQTPDDPPDSRGPPHWMEEFIPIVDYIFDNMLIPSNKELAIWEALEDRDVLAPTKIDASGVAKRLAKVTTVPSTTKTSGRLSCCRRRKQDSREEAYQPTRSNQSSNTDATAHYSSFGNFLTEKLNVYEFDPVDFPFVWTAGVSAWFLDLDERRLRARGVDLEAANPEDGVFESERDLYRGEWWERLKSMYLDVYHLMFEDDLMYYQEEQEAVLCRAQLLMFFYSLQQLFEVAFESHNGFERVMQEFCPPFARLPLQPPAGMEETASIIRGLCDRARAVGCNEDFEQGLELGAFQEKARSDFKEQLLMHDDLEEFLDCDDDKNLSLEELVKILTTLPLGKLLRKQGVPKDMLNKLVHDIASDLYEQCDGDRDGVVTHEEVREVIRQYRDEAEAREQTRNAGLVNRILGIDLRSLAESIPGTEAYVRHQKKEAIRMRKLRRDYEKLMKKINTSRTIALALESGDGSEDWPKNGQEDPAASRRNHDFHAGIAAEARAASKVRTLADPAKPKREARQRLGPKKDELRERMEEAHKELEKQQNEVSARRNPKKVGRASLVSIDGGL